MPRVHKRKARKQYNDDLQNGSINIGDTYYYWKFRNRPATRSKRYPKAKDLTQSAFLKEVYDINDTLSGLHYPNAPEDLSESQLLGLTEGARCSIDELVQQTQESLDNMPEHLQDTSSSGELLSSRIEALEEMSSQIEDICSRADDPPSIDDYEGTEDEKEEQHNEALQEWSGELIEELNSVQYEGG